MRGFGEKGKEEAGMEERGEEKGREIQESEDRVGGRER